MRKKMIAALIAISVIVLCYSQGSNAETFNPVSLSVTPSCASAGSPITITANANKSSGVYYKHWATISEGGPWMIVQDWSTNNTAVWTPTTDGRNTVAVWLAEDPSDQSVAQIVLSYEVGSSNCIDPVAISLSPPNGQVNEAVTITATVAQGGLFYQFWVAQGYGTPNYGNWQLLKDWSTDNTCTWTPTSPDWYVLEVRTTDDPNDPNPGEGLVTYKVHETFTFPFFPAMNNAVWWSRFSIYNNTDANGSAALTIYEQDGDRGTVDIGVPARGLSRSLLSTLLPTITPDPANTGALGDSSAFIDVSCDFNGSGFGMTGDSAQALGIATTVDRRRFTFPYFPPMDASSSGGWWAGFALYNNTAADGNATITVYEQDSDSGTYDVNVSARGLFITLNNDLLPLLTPAGTNTGILGDSTVFINVSCDFNGSGFGMTGDGTQASGIAATVGRSTFTFPYFPQIIGSGWWSSFSIYNNTNANGTAALTIYEQDGDKGTAGVLVPARGVYLTLLAALLPSITPDPANPGTLGDSSAFINVSCDFNGGGFGMTGDGTQALGIAATVDRSTFTFPYFPAMNDAVWWSGFSIHNNTDANGTAALTIYEQDGDRGMVDIEVPARGVCPTLIYTLLPSITPAPANTGTLGDSPVFIDVSCDFNGGGFGMTGDGTQAVSIPADYPCSMPGIPSSPLPSDNETNVSITANLDWADCNNTDSYDVYFGTSPSPPYLGTTSTSSYDLPDLGSNTTYHWKIVANNTCGSATGPVWSFTTSALTPPAPDIDANGSDGPITIRRGTNLKVKITLNPGSYAGQPADWWVWRVSPTGTKSWYRFATSKWIVSATPIQAFGGPISSTTRTVLNAPAAGVGTWKYYFAVDNNRNRVLDATWQDSVTVNVTR